MPLIAAFGREEAFEPLFTAHFDFLPRVGDVIDHDVGGYFDHYTVTEVWHHQDEAGGAFRSCLLLKLDN